MSCDNSSIYEALLIGFVVGAVVVVLIADFVNGIDDSDHKKW